MTKLMQLPSRLPAGTKYVIERRGRQNSGFNIDASLCGVAEGPPCRIASSPRTDLQGGVDQIGVRRLCASKRYRSVEFGNGRKADPERSVGATARRVAQALGAVRWH
jgi:hypothetical protein